MVMRLVIDYVGLLVLGHILHKMIHYGDVLKYVISHHLDMKKLVHTMLLPVNTVTKEYVIRVQQCALSTFSGTIPQTYA